jgi:hypothetical protein
LRGSPHQVVFDGSPEFRLVLGARAYEFPEESSGSDADWVLGSVELRAGAGLKVRASADVFWRTEELEAFNEDLWRLIKDGFGRAELEHLECEVSVTVTMEGDTIEISGYVTEHIRLRAEFRGFELHSRLLRKAQKELEALVLAFPVRSSHDA